MNTQTVAPATSTAIHFGKALTYYLDMHKKKHGTPIAFWAAKLGLDRAQIHNMKKQQHFRVELQHRVCEMFGVDIFEFLEKGAL